MTLYTELFLPVIIVQYHIFISAHTLVLDPHIQRAGAPQFQWLLSGAATVCDELSKHHTVILLHYDNLSVLNMNSSCNRKPCSVCKLLLGRPECVSLSYCCTEAHWLG